MEYTKKLMKSRAEIHVTKAKMCKFECDMNQSEMELQSELKDLDQFVAQNDNVYIENDNIHQVIKGADTSSKQ